MLLLCPFCPHEDGTGTITAGSAYPVHNRTQTENCVTKPRFYPQKGVSTMKREDVKNKITGITEEQPNWLMQENGSDITREKFLSTLSLRRATRQRANIKCKISYFYPRSPCGERQRRGLQNLHLRYFYPRSPCGERHILPITSNVVIRISIHALLAESDDTSKDTIKTVVNFYPRSPCGERHTNTYYAILSVQFLSTLSLRRATTDMRQRLIEFRFLSTLSLRRATS